MYFDPYSGYAPAGNLPSYYNPYTNISQQQPGQQMGQQGVPGRDTPTPGSKHGQKRKVRMLSPKGTMREVPEDQIDLWLSKGARRA